MSHRLRGTNAACCVAALVALTAGSAVEGAETPASVLLITLDTFRGDRLRANGAKQGETPCLDALAAEGVNFTSARAQVPLTLPSHASILTGLHPHSHGVRNNGVAALPETATTLAEVLRSRGYDTAAFVGSFVLDHRFGLDQGFDVYDDQVASGPEMLEQAEAERDGGEVVAAFESWLSGRPRDPIQGREAKPYFAWIHLYDPHAPYEAPEPFRGQYWQEPYAAEIAYTDSLVCRAVSAIESRGALDAVVAVVGDHGEGLGEHRETTHSLLIYNSTLHVPMLIRAPGVVPAISVPDLVRTIDLAPTLLDYLGQGYEFGEGVSLKPWIESRAAGANPPPQPTIAALSESLYAAHTLGWSPLFGLEADGFHFIQAPEPELYDLARDPGETRNVVAEHTATALRLERRLESLLVAAAGVERPAEVELDREEIEKLRSLGYLAGSARARASAEAADPGTLIDPKARIEVWERLQLGIGHYGRGDFESSARELEVVLRTERDMPLLFEYLSATYVRLGAWDKFERLHQLAAARGVESAAMHLDRGRRDRATGGSDRARRAFERALVLEPLSVTARYELGELYRADGLMEQARTAYRAALAINPSHVFSWNGLGVALAATGEPAAALEAFEHAAALAPRDPRGVLNLAVQLERMGRARDALRRYREALELGAAAERAEVRAAASAAIRRLQSQQ